MNRAVATCILGMILGSGGASSAPVAWTVNGLAPISNQNVTASGTVSGTFEFDATTGQFGTVALTSEGVTATVAGTTRQFGGMFASVTSGSGALQFSAITTTGSALGSSFPFGTVAALRLDVTFATPLVNSGGTVSIADATIGACDLSNCATNRSELTLSAEATVSAPSGVPARPAPPLAPLPAIPLPASLVFLGTALAAGAATARRRPASGAD